MVLVLFNKHLFYQDVNVSVLSEEKHKTPKIYHDCLHDYSD